MFERPKSAAARLFFLWITSDRRFGNTTSIGPTAFDLLSERCEGQPERIQAVLQDKKNSFYKKLAARGASHPYGVRVGPHDVRKVVFTFASVFYTRYVRDWVRVDPRYRTSGDVLARKRMAEVVLELLAQSSRRGTWTWDFFDDRASLSGKYGFFWATDASKIDAAIRSGNNRAVSAFWSLGKPLYVDADQGGPEYAFDYVLRIDLAHRDVVHDDFAVPSLVDARGWPFFLPSGDTLPRRGRTVNVSMQSKCTVRDGFPEWVHAPISLGESVASISPVAAVCQLPTHPTLTGELAGQLARLLRSRKRLYRKVQR